MILNGHDEETQNCAAASIDEIKANGSECKERPVTTFRDSGGITFTKGRGIAAVTVRKDDGFWSLTPDGNKSAPKSALNDIVEPSHNLDYANTLFVRADALGKPLGMPGDGDGLREKCDERGR